MNIKLTWNDIEDLVLSIFSKLDKNYNCIISIERGGSIPARLLSELTNIKDIYHYKISYYDGEIKKDTPIIKKSYLDKDVENKNILIIDDIIDSGDTAVIALQELRKISNTVDIAALITKQSSKIKPTYSGMDLTTKAWIDFPWESIKERK